jgi:Leucine-rich repeat (LRR) protein
MKHNKLCVLTVSLIFMMALGAVAQKGKPQKPAKKPTIQKADKPKKEEVTASQNEEKVKDLVAFFQLLLNTLASNTTSARDKDVVITESYAKIFRDAKVQVEDDLDEERKAITNKDVVAYLKDVDFFFENARFEFMVDKIDEGVNANGQVFYKVSGRRNLTGVTANGKEVNNTIPRFIEINYDADENDLKIASVYTNEIDEKEALIGWWTQLSLEWKSIFRKRLNIADSASLNDIKDMMTLQELDLSGNDYIRSIEPLSGLTNLKLLNLAFTNVDDLTPIRNLTELVELNLEGTKVFDLTPLRYASKLARLNIAHTDIRSVAVLEKMPAMQNLQMAYTHVIDFDPLSTLQALVNLDVEGTQIASLTPVERITSLLELNVSRTFIQDLSPLGGMVNLVTLNIDSTVVRNIRPLSSLQNLEVLYANYTFFPDLSPLLKLLNLERVYCDQTPIKRETAGTFMAARPNVLIIFDSKDLQAWWAGLSSDWRRVLSTAAKVSITPGKEELARVTNLDSVNFSNQRSINSLEALRKLPKLRIVLANNTAIDDLSPLQDLREIRYLDISDTEVHDLSPVSRLSKLRVLRADRSKIEKLDPLFSLKDLDEVYVDRTVIHDITAREFLEKNPDCLLVYKTIHLDRWWKGLSNSWKDVFHAQMGSDTTSSRENLHKLVEQKAFHFQEAPVHDLSAFSEFVRLSELHFSATGITEIPPLENLLQLTSLHATHCPLREIGAIRQLTQLQDLDISNTPIDDLRGLEGLENLKSFSCGGTQIRKLDPLENLHQLESLDCSITRVTQLDPVMYLSLRSLKCYNTKVSSREVDSFKRNNPDCHIVYYR